VVGATRDDVGVGDTDGDVERRRILPLAESATKRVALVGSKARPTGALKRALEPTPSANPAVVEPAIVDTAVFPVRGEMRRMAFPSETKICEPVATIPNGEVKSATGARPSCDPELRPPARVVTVAAPLPPAGVVHARTL
jgi:hypothetical protein